MIDPWYPVTAAQVGESYINAHQQSGKSIDWRSFYGSLR